MLQKNPPTRAAASTIGHEHHPHLQENHLFIVQSGKPVATGCPGRYQKIDERNRRDNATDDEVSARRYSSNDPRF